ncbi:MAG: RNA polymerase sigma factor [Candidatus Eisenbacteria bacterium]
MATQTLVERAAGGDAVALDLVCRRLRPQLVGWTRGRLPERVRSLLDTEDLVHDAMIGAIRNLRTFESRGEGSFFRYIQTAILNRIRKEAVRLGARSADEITNEIASPDPSPAQEALGQRAYETYRAALDRMSPMEQDLIIGHVELHLSAADLAIHTGKPSVDAARMALRRALENLARGMEG